MEQLTEGFQSALQAAGLWAPRVGLAIVILIVGYIVASIVRGAARKLASPLDRPFEKAADTADVTSEGARHPSIFVGVAAFWLVMLFAFVLVLNTLGLSGAASPFQALLDTVGAGVPTFLAAIALVALGFFLGTFARKFVTSALEKGKIDDRLAGVGFAPDKSGGLKLSVVLGWAAYALIQLIFIGSALGVLDIETLQQPIQNLFTHATDFLPKLLGAAVLVGVALLLATILRSVITAALAKLGVDKFSSNVGYPEDDTDSLSKLGGHVAYWLTVLFFAPAALAQLGLNEIVEPLQAAWTKVIANLPNLGIALLMAVLAYALAKIVGPLVQRILQGIGFDKLLATIGLAKLQQQIDEGEDRYRPSRIVANVAVAVIVLLISQEIFDTLGLNDLSAMVTDIVAFLPKLLTAIAIVGVALFLGDFVRRMISDATTHLSESYSKLLSVGAQAAIIVFGTGMALQQVNVGGELVANAILIILAATGLGLALAFGLGSREMAGEFVKKRVEASKTDAK